MKSLNKFNSRFRILKEGKISLVVSALAVSLVFPTHTIADIVIDELATTVTAPNDFTLITDVTDTNGGFAIDVNNNNGINGSITINSGVTLTSNSSTAIRLEVETLA